MLNQSPTDLGIVDESDSKGPGIILRLISQNLCAQSRSPMDMILLDEIVVGFEDSVGEPVIVSRMNCQTFSTGLSSGDLDGNGRMVMSR
jgi:hypothetical protein